MTSRLHMSRPLTTGTHASGGGGGGGGGALDARADDGYGDGAARWPEEYAYDDETYDETRAHDEADETAVEAVEADRQVSRLAELQARFAKLRAKAESEAMEEIMASSSSAAALPPSPGRTSSPLRRRSPAPEEAESPPSTAGSARPKRGTALRQRSVNAGRSNSSATGRKRGQAKASTSNIAWLEKIKREVDQASAAADDADDWAPTATENTLSSSGSARRAGSPRRGQRAGGGAGKRRGGGATSARARSAQRVRSGGSQRSKVMRHRLSHDGGAPSRAEVIRMNAKARVKRTAGQSSFEDTRSTRKLLQGRLQQRHNSPEAQRRATSAPRRPEASRRAASASARGSRTSRSVRFEAAPPPSTEDTRGRFGVESTGREVWRPNKGGATRRAVSAPRPSSARERNAPSKPQWCGANRRCAAAVARLNSCVSWVGTRLLRPRGKTIPTRWLDDMRAIIRRASAANMPGRQRSPFSRQPVQNNSKGLVRLHF